MTDTQGIAPLARRRADTLDAKVNDDFADLREKLAHSRVASEGAGDDAATLATLQESICRLISELKTSDETHHHTGPPHG